MYYYYYDVRTRISFLNAREVNLEFTILLLSMGSELTFYRT